MEAVLDRLKQFQPRAYAERMGLARALETGAKAEPLYSGGHVKANTVNEENGTLIAKVSSAKTDRMLDIVVPQGMDNANFRRNPVMLWWHDDSQMPIGRSLSEEAVADDGVYAEAQFDIAGMMGSECFRHYAEGNLSAFSIRFVPTKYERIMKTVVIDGVSTEKWTGGFQFQEWELLEFSAVPIPANPDCVALSANGVLHLAKRMGIEVIGEPKDQLELVTAARTLFKGFLSEGALNELAERLSTASPGMPPAGSGTVERTPAISALELKAIAEIEGAIESLSELGDKLRAT